MKYKAAITTVRQWTGAVSILKRVGRQACFGWVLAVMIVLPSQAAGAQSQPAFKAESFSSQLKADTRELAMRFAHDQVRIFESPVRDVVQKPANVRFLVPFAIAGTLIPADRHIEPTPSTGTVNAARQISNVGLIGTAASVGGLYIYGLKKHDEHAHEAGFLGTESFADSFVIKELVNVISGRLRPEEGNGHGDFFVNHSLDSSFPSGHVMLTWSMATVLAGEYPSKKNRIFWYAVGSTVAATRVVGRKHFTSDVIVGSAAGYLIGRYVFRAHHHVTDSNGFGWSPSKCAVRPGPEGVGPAAHRSCKKVWIVE